MSCKRINLISGPRNISTALMYSFGNRPDTKVVDEPMYAYYLSRTEIEHPGKEQILKDLPSDLEVVKQTLLFNPLNTDYYFIKSMAHHYLEEEPDFLLDLNNVFLIRDPKKLISSFSNVIPNPSLRDIGIKRGYELYQYLMNNGKKCLVLDSGEVLKNPEKVLISLCEGLEIPFKKEMLHWKPGPRLEDGVWAKYWYKNVHQSSGFQKNITKEVDLPERLIPLYEDTLPYYYKLYEESIKA